LHHDGVAYALVLWRSSLFREMARFREILGFRAISGRRAERARTGWPGAPTVLGRRARAA